MGQTAPTIDEYIADFSPDVQEILQKVRYIDMKSKRARHAIHTIFVNDLDALIAQIANRGLDPVEQETYANDVRKITCRDLDGNEIGFDGAPL